ncbi:MAG: TetR family transcriptional regulator [Sphingomonas sp.]|nr:MAG: TetR family transcriptional regulator [Sphingomonas sp.]
MMLSPAPAASAGASHFRSNRSKSEERHEKRAALLLASARMFNEHGFQATSLDYDAVLLGGAKSFICHHLGNKEQMLFQSVCIAQADLYGAATVVRSGVGTGLERLKAFLRRYAEVIIEELGRRVIRTGDELFSLEAGLEFHALNRQVNKMIQEPAEGRPTRVDNVPMTACALNLPVRWRRRDKPASHPIVAQRLVEPLCAWLVPGGR